MYDEDLVLLWADPNAGVGTVEGSGVYGEEDRGSDAWVECDRENREVGIESRQRRNIFI
jgi:hypothetical protein